MFSLDFNKPIFRIYSLGIIVFIPWLTLSPAQGQVVGCADTSPTIASPEISSCNIAQSAENSAKDSIEALAQNVQTISDEQTKKDFFEKLKTQAITDQTINAFNAWEYLGYGQKQQWDERAPNGCIRDFPEANAQTIQFIQERNAAYHDLSPEQFQIKKRQEWQDYQNELIRFSQTLEHVNRKISIDNSKLKNISLGDQRTLAQQLVTPDPSGISHQISQERDFHILQAYEVSNLFPVLLTPFDKRQSLEPPETQDSGLTLSYYLNSISNESRENPNVRMFGLSPQMLMERYIKKAVERMHQNALSTVGQTCSLAYSQDNLRKLVLLDGLTQKVITQNPEFKPLACSISTDIQKLRDPEHGWGKTVLYLGGMGLSCTLGWAATGPMACLTYVGITGAGIGAYETYNSINKAMTLNEDNKVLHDFFLSSVEGPSATGTKAFRDTEEALKRETLQAWINGTFSALDAVTLASLVRKGILPLKALTEVQEGGVAARLLAAEKAAKGTAGEFIPLQEALEQGQKAAKRASDDFERVTQFINDSRAKQGLPPLTPEEAQKVFAERYQRKLGREGLTFMDTPADIGVPTANAQGIVFDHHGPFFNPARPEQNTTMQVLDFIEERLAGPGTPIEKMADLKRTFKKVSTDNLGDGGWGIWISQHLDEIAADPALREKIRQATFYEDFALFGGKGFEEQAAQLAARGDHSLQEAKELQDAILDGYDKLLKKYGVAGGDRFHMLPVEKQRELMQEAQALIDDALKNGERRSARAQAFRNTQTQASKAVNTAHESMVAEIKTQLMSQGKSAQEAERLVLELSDEVYVFDGGKIPSQEFGTFSSWSAPAREHNLPLQLNVRTTADGRTSFILANPQGRTMPLTSLKPIGEKIRAAHLKNFAAKTRQALSTQGLSGAELDSALQKALAQETADVSKEGGRDALQFSFRGVDVPPGEIAEILADELKAAKSSAHTTAEVVEEVAEEVGEAVEIGAREAGEGRMRRDAGEIRLPTQEDFKNLYNRIMGRGRTPPAPPQPASIGTTYHFEGSAGVPSPLKGKNWQVVKIETTSGKRAEELVTVANGNERFSFSRTQFDELFKSPPTYTTTPPISGRVEFPGTFSSQSASVGEDLLVIRSKRGNIHTGQFGGIAPSTISNNKTIHNIYIIRDGRKHVIHLNNVESIAVNPTLTTVGQARLDTAPEALAHAQRHFAATVPENFSGSVITRWATPQEMMKDPLVVQALSGLDDVKAGRRSLEEVSQNLSDVGISIGEYDPTNGRYVLSFKTKESVGFTGVRQIADHESSVITPRGPMGIPEVTGQSPTSNKFHLVFLETDEGGQKVLNFRTAMVGDYTLPNVPLPLAQRIMGQSSEDARRLAREFFESAEGTETRQFWKLDKLEEASDYWRNHALITPPEGGSVIPRAPAITPTPTPANPDRFPIRSNSRERGSVFIPGQEDIKNILKGRRPKIVVQESGSQSIAEATSPKSGTASSAVSQNPSPHNRPAPPQRTPDYFFTGQEGNRGPIRRLPGGRKAAVNDYVEISIEREGRHASTAGTIKEIRQDGTIVVDTSTDSFSLHKGLVIISPDNQRHITHFKVTEAVRNIDTQAIYVVPKNPELRGVYNQYYRKTTPTPIPGWNTQKANFNEWITIWDQNGNIITGKFVGVTPDGKVVVHGINMSEISADPFIVVDSKTAQDVYIGERVQATGAAPASQAVTPQAITPPNAVPTKGQVILPGTNKPLTQGSRITSWEMEGEGRRISGTVTEVRQDGKIWVQDDQLHLILVDPSNLDPQYIRVSPPTR